MSIKDAEHLCDVLPKEIEYLDYIIGDIRAFSKDDKRLDVLVQAHETIMDIYREAQARVGLSASDEYMTQGEFYQYIGY